MKKIILIAKIYLVAAILLSLVTKGFIEGFIAGWHGLDEEGYSAQTETQTNIKHPYIYEYNVAQTNIKDSTYLITQISMNRENKKVDVYFIVGMIVVAIGVWLWIIFLIRSFKFLNNIQKNFEFIKANFFKLKDLAILLIAGIILTSVGDYLFQLNDKYSFNIAGFKMVTKFYFDYELLGIAICLLVAAFIIKEGTKLKEENDLTI